MSENIIVKADKLLAYCTALFKSTGMPENEAFINADNLVDSPAASNA